MLFADSILGSVFLLLVGIFIPLWIIPIASRALPAGAFWVQIGVEGAFGIVSVGIISARVPPEQKN